MNSEQRKNLRSYAEREDREPEPVFVGRENLFEIVAKNVRGAAERKISTGKTVCITGPPGVGKSAFVDALKKRKDFGGITAHCVEVSRADLYHPACVMAAFADAVPGFKTDSALRKWLKSGGLKAGVTASAGTGVYVAADWRHTAPPPFTTFPVGNFAQGAKLPLARGDAFILVVDEAQGIKNTPESKSNNLLADLHQGVKLPIVPVLAGLPNTQQNLRETISRYSSGNEPFMVGLSAGESRQYVEQMFAWLEVEGSLAQHEALADWIVQECGGWPHHLSNAMKAVAEGLAQARSLRLRDLNGEEVAASLKSRREEYYNARFSSQRALSSCREAVMSLVEKDGALRVIPNIKLSEEVAAALAAHPSPQGVSAAALEDALRASGVLARRKHEWICPIPSMARFIETGAPALTAPFPDLREGGGRIMQG